MKRSKKEQILNAAVKVFARNGFCNSKVRDVARAADVADGTIYLYFKNKDDLLISLFESKMRNILIRFNEHLAGIKDPVQKLNAFLVLYTDLIQSDRELAEVFQVELRQSSKFLKDYKNEAFSEYLNMISKIIDEGKSEGIFRPDLNTHVVKLLIFGAIDEVARQWILGDEDLGDLQTAIQSAGQTLIQGLLARA